MRQEAERALATSHVQLTAADLNGPAGRLARELAIKGTWTGSAEDLLAVVDATVGAAAP